MRVYLAKDLSNLPMYGNVPDLSQKMDAVDQISAAQQTNIQIKEQCDQILRKRKGLETSFNQIKQEFEEFQHQKQRHLNELNFSLALQFHQIQNLSDFLLYQIM